MFHTDIKNSQCSTNIYVTNHTKIKLGLNLGFEAYLITKQNYFWSEYGCRHQNCNSGVENIMGYSPEQVGRTQFSLATSTYNLPYN